MRLCTCDSGKESWELRDGHGIYIGRVCPDCEERKLAKFRPDILTQYNTDEPINED